MTKPNFKKSPCLSQVLCSMFRVVMLQNWAGPPDGKDENWLRDNVIEVRLSSEASRPSGSDAMQLFSTLNSSSRVELARDRGMEPDFRRLYLKNNKLLILNYILPICLNVFFPINCVWYLGHLPYRVKVMVIIISVVINSVLYYPLQNYPSDDKTLSLLKYPYLPM